MTSAPQSQSAISTVKLREFLVAKFDRDELEILCHDLGVDPENIPGVDRGKEYWALQIISHFDRRDALRELIDKCHELRPNFDWSVSSFTAADGANGATIGTSLRTGVFALIELLKQPAVRDIATGFQVHFQSALDQITHLADYKDLHDQLHELQLHCYNPIFQDVSQLQDDVLFSRDLAYYERTFENVMNALTQIAGRPSIVDSDKGWIQKLDQALQTMHSGIEKQDKAELTRAIRMMERVLDLQPALINRRLTDFARALRLQDLLRAVTTLRDSLAKLNVDQTQVQRFAMGVAALDNLNVNLPALVADHDRWQEVDDELKQVEDHPDDDLDTARWVDLKRMTEPLYNRSAERWAANFKTSVEKLDAALASSDKVKIRRAFLDYRRQADFRFFDVDKQLKTLCDSLRDAGTPLDMALSILKGGANG